MLSAIFLLTPNSKAAAIVMAFASPMPLIFIFLISDTGNEPSRFKSFFVADNRFFAISNAEKDVVPLLMRMANNSEWLKECAPFNNNFFLG